MVYSVLAGDNQYNPDTFLAHMNVTANLSSVEASNCSHRILYRSLLLIESKHDVFQPALCPVTQANTGGSTHDPTSSDVTSVASCEAAALLCRWLFCDVSKGPPRPRRQRQ